ncbi:MAG: hypothetical protein RhofKO_37220 [Rhodothermales bacterium]
MGRQTGMTKYFPVTPNIVPYLWAVIVFVGVLLFATAIFAGFYIQHKARVKVTESRLAIEKTLFWNTEIPYERMTRAAIVPVDRDSDYYPKGNTGYNGSRTTIGRSTLSNGQQCLALFSRDYAQGLYLEDVDGACYLLTVDKVGRLLELIESKIN